MARPPFHTLFLCTGNSARSLMAECALARWGAGRFRAFSAGSQPKSAPHPRTLALLTEQGFDVSALRSKSWDEFAGAEAPELQLVITVCDAAARETCPVWPGAPLRAHWSLADPAAARGSGEQVAAAFRRAWAGIEERVRALAREPLEELDAAEALARIEAIGRGEGLDVDP